MARQHKAHGADEQQPAEDIADPVKVIQQANAGGDERAAHDDGSRHSPEQHPRLSLLRNPKDAKQQQKDEQVVDRKRLFDRVRRQVLDAAL